MLWPLILSTIILVEVSAMFALTKYGQQRHIVMAVAGIIGYLSIGILFAVLMTMTKGSKLAFVNAAWNASTVFITTLLAVIVFHEKLVWYQWIAVFLAIMAVILLSIGEAQNS